MLQHAFFAGVRGYALEEEMGTGLYDVEKILAEREMREIYTKEEYQLRGFGRTVFPPEIFDYLGPDFASPETGKVDLKRTYREYTCNVPAYGVIIRGEPWDPGSCRSYYHYIPRVWELDS
ncbi:MAG TPA: hypothetical protein VK463_17310 [Desulfomonilaceae bacterium]|nr:hypothetical protein [Desulfomonilaceae bacterium]